MADLTIFQGHKEAEEKLTSIEISHFKICLFFC